MNMFMLGAIIGFFVGLVLAVTAITVALNK